MCNSAQVGEAIFAVLTLELTLRGEVGVQMSFLFSILFILAQAYKVQCEPDFPGVLVCVLMQRWKKGHNSVQWLLLSLCRESGCIALRSEPHFAG